MKTAKDPSPGQLWQDKRNEQRVVKVLSVSALTVEYLRQYKARTTTGLTLIRSFRGDYKLIAEQEEQ